MRMHGQSICDINADLHINYSRWLAMKLKVPIELCQIWSREFVVIEIYLATE